MRAFVLTLLLASTGFGLFAQSLASKELGEQYDATLNLFFYRNTLRMVNFNDDPEFDEMIKGIEKMRFIMLEKEKNNFGAQQYKSLISSYTKENYEEIMSMRHEDTNFNVYIKEEKGINKGMLLLANADDNLILLDILGNVPFERIGQLYSTVSQVNGRGKPKTPPTEGEEKIKKTEQETDH